MLGEARALLDSVPAEMRALRNVRRYTVLIDAVGREAP